MSCRNVKMSVKSLKVKGEASFPTLLIPKLTGITELFCQNECQYENILIKEKDSINLSNY